jgi:hypothetical protein
MLRVASLVLALAWSSIAAAQATPTVTLADVRAAAVERGWARHDVAAGACWAAEAATCAQPNRLAAADFLLVRDDRLITARLSDGALTAYLDLDLVMRTFGIELRAGSQRAVISWSPSIDVSDRTVSLPADPAMATDLAGTLSRALERFLAPGAFAAEARAQIHALQRQAHAALATIGVCDRAHDPARYEERADPSGAVGIFDTCVRRMLTPTEIVAARRAIDAELGPQLAVVNAHAEAWSRLVRAIVGR